MQLDSLDTVVEKTITFFDAQKDVPHLDTTRFRMPLVVWSGNGAETGKILFRKAPAFFAGESDAGDKIALLQVEEVVVVSASGSKHAPILIEQAKTASKKTILISSTPDSEASSQADETFIYPKITEPYTYNTSTYFGYIYGTEQWNYSLKEVWECIEKRLKPLTQGIDFSQYDAFFVVLPNEFALLKNMVETKCIELFGRKIARDVATYEQVKHAMTVVPSEKELFLCFGNKSGKVFGKNQVNLPVFDHLHYGPMMLIAYWVVGQIQRAKPPYFMENISCYCENSEYSISPIVTA